MRYGYASGDPINRADPTGKDDLVSELVVTAVQNEEEAIQVPADVGALSKAYALAMRVYFTSTAVAAEAYPAFAILALQSFKAAAVSYGIAFLLRAFGYNDLSKSFANVGEIFIKAGMTFGGISLALQFLAATAGFHCFPADTPVATELGSKPIQEVQGGDRVWAFDVVASEWKLCRVIETYRHEHDGTMVAATVAGEVVESTGHHPYWVVRGEALEGRPRPGHVPGNPPAYRGEGRWVDSIDLRVGDVLLLRSREQVPITALVIRQARLPVYNFQVEDLHCYAVGHAQILVHNNSNDDPGDQSKDPYNNLGSYQNQKVADNASIKSVAISPTPVTDYAGKPVFAKTSMTAGGMTITLTPGMNPQDQSVTMYHEVAEAVALEQPEANLPMFLQNLSDNDYTVLGELAFEQYGPATPDNISRLLREIGL
jgi:hypothetical protein